MTTVEICGGASIISLVIAMTDAKKRILWVEDEETLLVLLRRILGAEGYEVETAVNGQEAIDILKDRQFDLVGTDIKMDYVDGMELSRHIRETYPEIPILVLSGYGDGSIEEELISMGVKAFIAKPFSVDELLQQVAEHLSA